MIPLHPDKVQIAQHINDVRPIVVGRINDVLQRGFIKKGKKRNITILLSDELRFYLSILLRHDLLQNILKGELALLTSEILYNRLHNKSFETKSHPDYIILYNIFVSHGYGKLDKFKFIRRINIDTCPYCNRNYIYTNKNNKKVKPEIDHFYPTSIYPMFAVSFYNMIPSCQTCNGPTCKHNVDSHNIQLVNPYSILNSNYLFSYKVNNISFVNPLSGKSSVDVVLKYDPFVLPNVKTFNLAALYVHHHDHVLELIIKRRLKYSEKYKAYLNKVSNFKLSNAEIDRMILGNYATEKEQHKRPLSKLYQDIGRELGLIK